MKLQMMRGLPASGKSTYARKVVTDSGSFGRINRDDLRTMLFNSVWSGKREEVIVACEKAIAKVLFDHKMSAVIDDTNLSEKHRQMWSEFTRINGQNFEMKDLAVSIEECRVRDAVRPNPVGRAIIDRMALYNGLIDWGDKPIVLVDVDGTVADGRHREHHVTGENKDWKAYYALIGNDSPIDFVVRWVRELSVDHTICFVSGRPDTYQNETMQLFEREDVNIRYDWLFMRSAGDKRPDVMIKNDILKRIPKDRIAFAIDDRPCVIREVWRANDVRVFPVRGDCEDF